MKIADNIAKDGTPIWIIQTDEKEYMLNSNYNPIGEAQRFSKRFVGLKSQTVFVFGFGNGLIPREIVNICDSTNQILFYEPCVEIAHKLADNPQLLDGILKSNVQLFLPNCELVNNRNILSVKSFVCRLENVVLYHNLDKLEFVDLPKYKEFATEEYENYYDSIRYRIQILQANGQNANAIGHIAVKNNVRLLPYLVDSYCADELVGKFPLDMDAIIVSAGPSLSKNVDLLSKAKGKALIVCVDTAAGYLLAHSIVPDLIITLDPRKELDLFDDVRIREIPLVGVADMSIDVLEKVNSRKLILTSAENPFVQRLYKLTGHKISKLESGGSVATMAYSFCRYIGFKRIVLVGQDLALTDEKMYVGKGKLDLKHFDREIIEVEDVFGKIVYTTRDYYYYLKWFEQVAVQDEDITLIDATEGGAKINGSIIQTLSEVVGKYKAGDMNIVEIINSIHPVFSNEKRELCKEAINQEKANVKELVNRLNQGIKLAEIGIKKTNISQWIKTFEASVIVNQINSILEYFDTLDCRFLIMREIDATDLTNYLKLCNIELVAVDSKWFLLMKKYFECIRKATYTICEIYEKL